MGQTVVKDTLDFYQIQGVEQTGKELGRGCYSKVCEVEYFGTLCAAKEIDAEKVAIETLQEAVELLANECFNLIPIRHPNIIQFIGVYGSFKLETTQPFMMVMEKMDCSLWQYEQDTSPIPLHSALCILYDVSLGLLYLHSSNPPCLHGNLSPHHILINTGTLVAKICSFKKMKELKSSDEANGNDGTSKPETSHFASPNISTDEPKYCLQLDVFSYGQVALFAVGGGPNNWADDLEITDTKVEAHHCEQYLEETAVLRPLVEECLNNDPLKRPAISNVSIRVKDILENHIKQNPLVKFEMMSLTKEYCPLLESQLQYANEHLLQKNQDIAEKDQQLCQRSQEICDKSQVLQLNYQDLQSKLQEIQRKNQRILKSDQNIQKRNLQIQQRDMDIQQRDEMIQLKHKELQKMHKEMKLQLQQKHQEAQQKDQLLQQTILGIHHKELQLQELNKKIQQEDQQIQLKVQEMQKRWKQMQQQLEDKNQKLKQYDKRLQEKSQETIQKGQQMHALEVDKQILQQHVDELQTPTWVIRKCDIRVLDKRLGTGGWGTVCEAIFRGSKVAVKSLDNNIISHYNLGLFSREMDMASRCRHPNLLQFIGATNQGLPLIVTELMHTSLRKILEQGTLYSYQIIPILLGVAYGLNYLHKTTPDPILHRDVSSANVLLNPLPNNQWHPKLSDFGSTNFMRASNTISAGNPAYAAPEALSSEGPHTPAMDVFSFGVLMFEMCSREFPAQQPNQSTINHVKWDAIETTLIAMIRLCLAVKYEERPAIDDVMNELNR